MVSAKGNCKMFFGMGERFSDLWRSVKAFFCGQKALVSTGSWCSNAKHKVRRLLTNADRLNVLRHSLIGHFHSLGQSRRSEQGLAWDSYTGTQEGMEIVGGMTGLERTWEVLSDTSTTRSNRYFILNTKYHNSLSFFWKTFSSRFSFLANALPSTQSLKQ